MEGTASTIEETGQFAEEAQEPNKEPVFFVDASGDADIDQVSLQLKEFPCPYLKKEEYKLPFLYICFIFLIDLKHLYNVVLWSIILFFFVSVSPFIFS